MLDNNTVCVIKSTLPLLQEIGPKLTAHFYERMFNHHPELKNIFNMSNQQNGQQRQALFDAICAYAANIDNLSALLPAVERIAQKHASFNIQPTQYPIVGQHLLATIDELLNPGQEVLDAWAKAYQLLANIFIQREEEIYQSREDSSGGWRGLRAFQVVKKEVESDVITSFILAPQDNEHITDYKPGQYLAVYINHQDLAYQEIRQYSLTTAPNGQYYRIAVKREDKGAVSTFLHQQTKEGDTLYIAPPCGDFSLDIAKTTPVALISAGVGQTPMLSMLHTLHKQHHPADVYWLHAAENGKVHAFANEISEITQQMPNLHCHIWYREPHKDDIPGQDYHSHGLMDLNLFAKALSNPQMHYYFCGPIAFMQSIAKQLIDLGADPAHLHYECFGPQNML